MRTALSGHLLCMAAARMLPSEPGQRAVPRRGPTPSGHGCIDARIGDTGSRVSSARLRRARSGLRPWRREVWLADLATTGSTHPAREAAGEVSYSIGVFLLVG